MLKKLRLSLEDLRVQSFVTALNEEDKSKIKGKGTDDPVACSLTLIWCCGYTPLSCETCNTCHTCEVITCVVACPKPVQVQDIKNPL